MISTSVCEFQKLSKASLTQQQLRDRCSAREIEAYRQAHRSMNKPMREGRRCWILYYADGAQFHMDMMSALPNGQSRPHPPSKRAASIRHVQPLTASRHH